MLRASIKPAILLVTRGPVTISELRCTDKNRAFLLVTRSPVTVTKLRHTHKNPAFLLVTRGPVTISELRSTDKNRILFIGDAHPRDGCEALSHPIKNVIR